MSQEPATLKRKINYFAYVSAWLVYIGKVFQTAGNIGNTVRDSFINISVPKKEDFYE